MPAKQLLRRSTPAPLRADLPSHGYRMLERVPIDHELMEGWVIDRMTGRERIAHRMKSIQHQRMNRDPRLTPREQATNDELLLNAINAADEYVQHSDFDRFSKFIEMLDKLDREAI